MTAGVLAMGLVTLVVAGAGVSACIGAALPVLDRAAARVAPRAGSWLWRAAALAPWPVAGAVLGAVFALVPDHCLVHGAHHPHLCLQHAAAWPSWGLALWAGSFVLRAGTLWIFAALGAARSWRVRRRLEVASVRGDYGVRQLPGPDVWAVTAGLLHPRVFVTEPLARDADLPVVLAHEQLHARGRHGLWQWLVTLSAALHLPGVGRAIGRRVAVAQEMAADEAAGRTVGDRARVADTLVRLARRVTARPATTLTFVANATPLEMRVHSLLRAPRVDASGWVGAAALTALGLVAWAVGAHAAALHHGLETLFGYLG